MLLEAERRLPRNSLEAPRDPGDLTRPLAAGGLTDASSSFQPPFFPSVCPSRYALPRGLEGGPRVVRAPNKAQDGPTGAPASPVDYERWRTMADVGPTSSPTCVQEAS